MMRGIILFLFFCQVVFPAWAQLPVEHIAEKPKDTLTLRLDSTAVSARTFHPNTLAKYKHDSAFDYREEVAPINWWQALKQWFYQWLAKLFVNNYSATAFKWLFIAIGVGALLFFVYKLSGMDLMGIFGKNRRAIRDSYTEEAEDIHAIDFDREIKAAVDLGRFRQAVRLLYLQSLKELTDKQLIDWQPGKTNKAYIQELSENDFKKDFSSLTGQFEYIWYGDFPIQEAEFTPLQHQFSSFRQLIR